VRQSKNQRDYKFGSVRAQGGGKKKSPWARGGKRPQRFAQATDKELVVLSGPNSFQHGEKGKNHCYARETKFHEGKGRAGHQLFQRGWGRGALGGGGVGGVGGASGKIDRIDRLVSQGGGVVLFGGCSVVMERGWGGRGRGRVCVWGGVR